MVRAKSVPDPLSSEAVGVAPAFEFQNIPDPLSSEAVRNIGIAKSVRI